MSTPPRLSLAPTTMEYRLAFSPSEHLQVVEHFFTRQKFQPADLTLLPSSGPPLTTHSLPLCLLSPSLRSLLHSLPPSCPLSLSVPASSSSLELFLQLLSSGLVLAPSRGFLQEVKDVAKVLGVDLDDCQMGARRKKIKVKEENVEVYPSPSFLTALQVEEKVEDVEKYENVKVDESMINKVKEESIKEVTGKYFCSDCEKQFKYKKPFMRHQLSHMTENCENCPKTFKNSYHLSRHNLSSHLGIRLSCDNCRKTFTRKDKLKKHQRVYHLTL